MQNVLFLFIQFILLLFLGMFWYKLLKWSPEESICMAILSVMTAILVGGYIGYAQIALVFLNGLAVIGIILFLGGKHIKILNVSEQKGLAFFSPGIIMIILVFFYGVVAFWGLEISNWDELHQWGKSVVFMLNRNALPMGDNFDGESILLSSTTLFHYYICKLPKVFTHSITESNMYVSNLILWFSAIMLPLSDLEWKEWKRCLCYAVTIFLSMNVLFVQAYYNIYCDQPVTMWAGSLIAWIVFCKKKKYHPLFILLAILHISYMKNMMGPLFSVIILVVLLMQYWLTIQVDATDKLKTLVKTLSLHKVFYGVCCCVAVFFVTIIWSIHINENALIRAASTDKGKADRFNLTIISGLSKWFQPVNLNKEFPVITFFIFFILTVCIGYVILKKYIPKAKEKIYQKLLLLYIIGFFGYFAIMIYSYMTTFSYADSIVTGSFHRYMSDYILLGIIPITMPIYLGFTSANGKINVLALILLVFFSLGTTNGFPTKSFGCLGKQEDNYIERIKFNSYKKKIKKLVDTDEKIYMINQDTDGYFTVVADYELGLQLDRTGMCYYFTEETEDEIAGLSSVDIHVLPQILLRDYGYLWIYKTDGYFDSVAFDVLRIKKPKKGDFYKVINENGRLRLEYLGKVQKG